MAGATITETLRECDNNCEVSNGCIDRKVNASLDFTGSQRTLQTDDKCVSIGSVIATAHQSSFLPTTPDEKAEVMNELNAILSHPQFSQSKRYPALLRYLVEHTLRGDTAHIKERTLGIEVFGRSASYDTNNDTIVRFTASEVRRRLAAFYNQQLHHAIQIALPVGSYIPEFLREDPPTSAEPALIASDPPPAPLQEALSEEHALVQKQVVPLALTEPARPALPHRNRHKALWIAAGIALALLCACVAGLLYARLQASRRTAVDRFWYPLTTSDQAPLIVAGGNVFSRNPYSGTETAGREVDYPFVSMQIASAVARVSASLYKSGHPLDVLAANATTLNDLRDRPIVLIGGYNNVWTAQLTGDLPIRLAPSSSPAFKEIDGAQRVWRRDSTQPYSAANDFALIGRFRSATAGSTVVLLAGLGRNGSEAASQFLTDGHRLETLEQQIGSRLDGKNFEAVLQVPVVQGRTGAPKLLAFRQLD